jgi:hypothetical protein
MSTITNPFSYFADGTTGRPLINGYLYFGEPDTDPTIEANQITVRSIGTGGVVTEIDQPIRTNESGVAVAPTTMAPFILDVEELSYSVEFQNSQQVAVYTSSSTSSVLPSTVGEAGKFLFTDGETISWESVLPDQSGQAGKFLTTNGTNPSWATVLPDQAGEAGKFLTTDGTEPSWGEGLPDQTGEDGKYLTTNGINSSWEDVSFSSSTAFRTDDELVHSIPVVFPASGRLLLWSSLQLRKGNVGSGTISLNLQGNVYTSTAGQGATNSAICTLIISGNPGDSVTISSVGTTSGSGFNSINHITMIQIA